MKVMNEQRDFRGIDGKRKIACVLGLKHRSKNCEYVSYWCKLVGSSTTSYFVISKAIKLSSSSKFKEKSMSSQRIASSVVNFTIELNIDS